MRIVILFSVFVLFVSPGAKAETIWDTGEGLLRSCETAVELIRTEQLDDALAVAEMTHCAATVEAVAHTLLIVKKMVPDADIQICIPADVRNIELIRVVLKYLKESPDSLHEFGIDLTVRAYRAAFPCM